jgi:hypothetical protein
LWVIGRNEDISEWDSSFSVHGKVLRWDFIKKWDRVAVNEFRESFRCERTSEIVATFVECLVHDQSGRSNSSLWDGGRICWNAKEIVITVWFGEWIEDSLVDRIGFVEVGDEYDLVSALEGDVVIGGDCGDGRKSLSGIYCNGCDDCNREYVAKTR